MWCGGANRWPNWNVWGPTLLLSLPRGPLVNKAAGSFVRRAAKMILIRWLGTLEPKCTRRLAKRVECWSTVPSPASQFGWEPDPRFILTGRRILEVFWLGYWFYKFDETTLHQLIQDVVTLMRDG